MRVHNSFSKCVSHEMNFLSHHIGMMSLLQYKELFKHYRPFKKHNKTWLKSHFIHGPKSIILQFPFTYVNTTVTNPSIKEANFSTQTQSFISNVVSRFNVFLWLKHNYYSPFIYLVYPNVVYMTTSVLLKTNSYTQIRQSSWEAINRSQSFIHLAIH